jgi:glycosyltransferase involved in cell wall biosynthesis
MSDGAGASGRSASEPRSPEPRSPEPRPTEPGARRRSVSVVIPCLNEAGTIAECVRRARGVLAEMGGEGEVVVVDNGSVDGSATLAREAGATVIEEPRRGYGRAYLTGFAASSGDDVVMIDADLTYDFAEIPRFVELLDAGAQLVMGNRMRSIQPGAMSILSRIGNPILSGFLNLLHSTPVADAHCGMRAVRREALAELELGSTGMEFASEMVIRASKLNLDVQELPIKLHVRGGESKLAPFRDGWRHLRLILIYSPDALFIVPGALMNLLGVLIAAIVLSGVTVFGRALYVHTLIGASALVIVGTQIIGLGLCGRAYAVYAMGERDRWIERMQGRVRLEHGLLFGLAVASSGLAVGGVVVGIWIRHRFGSLGEEQLAIVAMTLLITGIQIFFTSFLLSLLGLRRR